MRSTNTKQPRQRVAQPGWWNGVVMGDAPREKELIREATQSENKREPMRNLSQTIGSGLTLELWV